MRILDTPGAIAGALGTSVYTIQNIVRALNIRPASRAGQLRVFDAQQVQRIRAEVERRRALRRARKEKGGVA